VDLFGYLIIFLLFVIGFVFMGWLTFGADTNAYNTFENSFGTCWNFLLGNPPDWTQLAASNRVLGPFFFTMFTIFIFFILANMFIGIVSNSYGAVTANEPKYSFTHMLENTMEDVKAVLSRGFKFFSGRDLVYKRSVKELLRNLANPDVLQNPHPNREEVARAIGPTATELEIEDLYNWIKKVEDKKSKARSRRIKQDDDDTPPEEGSSGVQLKEQPQQIASGSNDGDVQLRARITALQAEVTQMRTTMQADMAQMKQLLQQVAGRF
jgi:hypothetical protein